MVLLIWIGGDRDGYETLVRRNQESAAPQRIAVADAVPLPTLPLPPRGRGQFAAAGEPDDLPVDRAWLDGEVGSGLSQGATIHRSDLGTIQIPFFRGYFDAGGRDEARIDAMVKCESSWHINPPGIHLGLSQFDSGTWATVSAITGLTDPYNPYHQGYNVSVWASMISPGTTAGWPRCFSAIDW